MGEKKTKAKKTSFMPLGYPSAEPRVRRCPLYPRARVQGDVELVRATTSLRARRSALAVLALAGALVTARLHEFRREIVILSPPPDACHPDVPILPAERLECMKLVIWESRNGPLVPALVGVVAMVAVLRGAVAAGERIEAHHILRHTDY